MGFLLEFNDKGLKLKDYYYGWTKIPFSFLGRECTS
jgi:hypothetical protein